MPPRKAPVTREELRAVYDVLDRALHDGDRIGTIVDAAREVHRRLHDILEGR